MNENMKCKIDMMEWKICPLINKPSYELSNKQWNIAIANGIKQKMKKKNNDFSYLPPEQ